MANYKTDYKSAYSKKLLDPQWQRKRLAILNRDDFQCQFCFAKNRTLHVHHKYYKAGAEPWEYPDEALITYCAECHQEYGGSTKDDEFYLISTLHHANFASAEFFRIANALYRAGSGMESCILTALEYLSEHPEESLRLAGLAVAELNNKTTPENA